MFVILLKFSKNKARAGELMQAHNEWIKRGVDEGIFLLVGSLQPGLGGAVMAHNITEAELEKRVNLDPFVAQDVVKAEILHITPAKTDPRLSFLLE